MTAADWPALPFTEWADTCNTRQLWTQIVGKIRLAHTPTVNHWWNVPLYVTSRGLTTSLIPHGTGFQIDFDFIDHNLKIETSAGDQATIRLEPKSVADFHAELMTQLRSLGLENPNRTMPLRYGMQSRSIRTTSTLPMMPNTPTVSGAFCCRPTG